MLTRLHSAVWSRPKHKAMRLAGDWCLVHQPQQTAWFQHNYTHYSTQYYCTTVHAATAHKNYISTCLEWHYETWHFIYCGVHLTLLWCFLRSKKSFLHTLQSYLILPHCIGIPTTKTCLGTRTIDLTHHQVTPFLLLMDVMLRPKPVPAASWLGSAVTSHKHSQHCPESGTADI